MRNPWKFLIVIILLVSAIFLSFPFPKTKYIGTGFLTQLQVPYKFADWQGKDASLNLTDDRYNFISQIFAREYVNRNGQNLLLIILDADNFHYPNVCFTSSGFEVKELDKTEFIISNRTFKAYTFFTMKGTESFLVIYWIIIDKKMVPDWIQQKIKQLYYPLFKKKKIGLMVRLDIPIKEDNIEEAVTLSKQFINNMSQALLPEQAEYILGEIK